MSKETEILVNGLIFGACMFFFGFSMGKEYHQKLPVEPIKTKVDTLFIRDTITQIKPVSVERRVVETQLVPVIDSVRIHDTTFVYLEREQVVWRDSLSEVYASGIMPQVDSVRHFTESRYITIETQVPVKVRSRWGLGVNAGYGVGKGGLMPYVGVGVSYNLISW